MSWYRLRLFHCCSMASALHAEAPSTSTWLRPCRIRPIPRRQDTRPSFRSSVPPRPPTALSPSKQPADPALRRSQPLLEFPAAIVNQHFHLALASDFVCHRLRGLS